ncbi:MAG: divalent metal cation transporter, partial [Nitrospiraceae bacterium]|nr:divalent metal cation transporter [Nitrospiraceae bacterium]
MTMRIKAAKASIVRHMAFVKELGPGIITGGAGDDPAGIVTYTIVGATTKFSFLWLVIFSTLMMVAVQNTVSRIAIVTGKSLPEIINMHYRRSLTIFVITILATANILTIGADMDAIASIFGVIIHVETIYLLIPITLLIAYLVIFKAYRTVKRIFLGLTLSLSVYALSAIIAKPSIKDIVIGCFIPHFSLKTSFIVASLGFLGTTISPYLLFWQASEERQEQKTVVQAKVASLDTVLGMVYSNLITFFIIIASAATLHGVRIKTVKDAAIALKPIGGHYAFVLFSIGIVASGFLAIPVLAGSTAYAVADTFGWREGMDYKVSNAKGFYTVFLISLLIGDLLNLLRISTVDALYYSQVLDGILLPLLMV